MSRWDNYVTGNAEASVSRGYGRGFERNCVTQQTGALQDTSSYHRITSFCMGGLSFLLQHEADAFFCPCHTQELNGTETTVPQTQPGKTERRLSHGVVAKVSSSLNAIAAGMELSTSCIVEIKSREKKANNPRSTQFHRPGYQELLSLSSAVIRRENSKPEISSICISELKIKNGGLRIVTR